MPVRAGKLVEKGGLSAVLVAYQGKGKDCPLRQRLSASLRMEPAALSQAGMFGFAAFCPLLLCFGRLLYRCNLDPAGICKPECKLVAVYHQLHGIPEGGQFGDRDLDAGNNPHIKKMLAESSISPNLRDNAAVSDLYFVKCHFILPMVRSCL